jgi:predicted acylesterase/phospholipase RssA
MKYDLVFEGGGAKGMVFVGAMQEFETRGHQPGRLLGTSAGAITATLLAAGYTASEMLKALEEKQADGSSVFSSFMAPPGPFDSETVNNSAIRKFLHAVNSPLIPDFLEDKLDDAIVKQLAEGKTLRHFFSFIEKGGWFSADNFLAWIKGKLNAGNLNGKPRNFGDMSLRDFYTATGSDLSLVASDTTGKQMLVLNHNTAPDCPVIWATRMSMSIPLLWQEVVWQKEWGLYMKREMLNHAIVDGGLLSNFPIELFLSDLKDITDVMGLRHDNNVLGMLIDEEAEVPNLPQLAISESGMSLGDLQTVQRISRLVDTTLSARDKMVIDSYANLVARMPARGYGTTEFDMTPTRREALVEAGKTSMHAYFVARERAAASDTSFGIGDDVETDQDVINKRAAKILK